MPTGIYIRTDKHKENIGRGHIGLKYKNRKPMSEIGRENCRKGQIKRCNNPLEIKKRSMDSRKRYENPIERIKASNKMKELFSNPKFKEKHKEAFNNQKYKELRSKIQKEKWANKDYREHMVKAHRGYKWTEEQHIKEKTYMNKPATKEMQSNRQRILMNRPEIKEKIANTKVRNVLNGITKSVFMDTKPELKVLASYISKGYKEGIDIVKQYYVKGIGKVDFFLPKENTLIFVDGDYWHCNPAKYKPCYYISQLNKFAKQIWDKDNEMTLKSKELGYKVIRLWETDIKNNVYTNQIGGNNGN